MTKWLAIAASCLLATSVSAGEWNADGKDPHASGGCDSKAKVARLKQLYGEDFFKQHPHLGKSEKSDAVKADKKDAKEPSRDEFI